MLFVSSGGMLPGHNGLKPHNPVIQALNTIFADLVSFIQGEPGMHTSGAFKRVMGIMFIHEPHQF